MIKPAACGYGECSVRPAKPYDSPAESMSSKDVSILSGHSAPAVFNIDDIRKVLTSGDDEEKKNELASLLSDHTGGSASLQEIKALLMRYPLESLKKAHQHGVTIHLLKDDPSPSDFSTADLGFDAVYMEGRSWDEMKGGYNPVATAMFIRKNTDTDDDPDFTDYVVLHEFAHAVFDATIRDGEKGEQWFSSLRDLYEKAGDGKKFLNENAGLNINEYFAECAAASLDPCTKGILEKKDAAMFSFLQNMWGCLE